MNGYETITLNQWQDVSDYADSKLTLKPSFVSGAFESGVPVDALSKGQLASKAWLYSEVSKYVAGKGNVNTVALYGCWVGALVEILFDAFEMSNHNIERLYGFDLDPEAIEIAEKLNAPRVINKWQFKGVIADVCKLDSSNLEFVAGDKLLNCVPDVIVNTSCEHMGNEWFETASNQQLIVMQANNSENEEGHINVCKSISEMEEKYPLDPLHTVYKGELVMPNYTRFMQIGYKS